MSLALHEEEFDFTDDREPFLTDVVAGLARRQKELPCKYFYDAEGSRLFDRICCLPEYYPTRTERAIMSHYIGEIVEAIGPGAALIEYGSGSSVKTRLLLQHARELAAYVPLDISREHLAATAERLAVDFPSVPIHPVCADFTQDHALPPALRRTGRSQPRRVVFFPGSTIGNFMPEEAVDFLRHIAGVCGARGALLIGVDLKKDPAPLLAAYNDAQGVTAAFNLNLLARANRELEADFDLERFAHYAFYNPHAGRIEMHLASLARQQVHVAGRSFDFQAGETIWTESSHKYSLEDFAWLARRAGMEVRRAWTDPGRLFSVQYLTPS